MDNDNKYISPNVYGALISLRVLLGMTVDYPTIGKINNSKVALYMKRCPKRRLTLIPGLL